MKKQLLFAAIACLFFISCNKRSSNPLPTPTPPASFQGYFSGKLNGVFFKDTTSRSALIVTANNGLQIVGNHTAYGASSIILWLKPYNGMIGENVVNQNNDIFINKGGPYCVAGFINGKIQGSGKINILEITSSFIRGTFECIAPADSSYSIIPTQVITEGEFKLKKP